MNNNQKIVLIGIVALLLLQMAIFTPLTIFYNGQFYYSHGSMFTSHNSSAGDWAVDVPRFILYWGIIGIIGGLFFFITKNNKKK